MALTPGTRFGPYEIVGPLGAGGMGEVFRARDTRLNRDVAVKALSESMAHDADRRARFEREAQILASLNHPHIASIYGFEEVHPASGAGQPVAVLVLELVDGPTLADRLAGSPIPLDEVLSIARQMADALEAAHARGIVHRDLKPANIKIRGDGTVKVLDFGLAKVNRLLAATEFETQHVSAPKPGAVSTEAGMILGTVAYMSPEQAKGREADKRSDVWAFGCVLFEMLAASTPFPGDTPAEVLAAVLHVEPNWSALRAGLPASIARLLRRCLQKDPRKRLHDIADARLDLDEAADASPAPAPIPAAAPATAPARARASSRASSIMPWAIAALMTAIAGGAIWMARPRPSAATPPMRVAVTLPPSSAVGLSRGAAVAVSPDGRQLVYVATGQSGTTQLQMRPFDRLDAAPIPGTEGAADPFFSPDGQWVGFFAGGKLKKVSVSGGSPTTLADAPNPRGYAWGPDDRVYFTPRNNATVWRVPATGGTPEEATKLAEGELSHRWPQIVAGGKAILFTIWNDTGFEGGRIAIQRLGSAEHRVLVTGGGYPRIVGPDAGGRTYLVYATNDGLSAAAFDIDRLAVTGSPIPVLDNVITNLSGGAHFGVSAEGVLAYLPGTLGEVARTFVWVDRQGHETPAAVIQGSGLYFKLSPDGRRIVRQNTQGPDRDLWIEDLERGTSTRFTFGGTNFDGLWTDDGKWIAYSAGVPASHIFLKRADGSVKEEQLTTSPNGQRPSAWTPDGRTLLFIENDPVTATDIWSVSLDGDRKPRPFLRTPFIENYATLSPDGRWLAYASNESGQFEIYVMAFPDGGRKWQISSGGGTLPAWSHSGRELFYRNANAVLSVAVSGTPEFTAERPKTLFEARYDGTFEIAPGDQKLLMIKGLPQDSSSRQINVVLNWFEDLARLARPK